MALTFKKIDTIKAIPNKVQYIADDDGLYLKVSKGGAKTFIYRYKPPLSKARERKEIALGHFPELGLADAREARLVQSRLIQGGKDPLAVKQAVLEGREGAITVEQLGERFYNLWLKPHYEQPDEAYAALKRDPIRILGNTLAQDVTKEQIMDVFDKMVKRDAKVSGNRTLTLTRKMFDWAIGRGIVVTNPVTVTAKHVGGKEKSRDVNLTIEQLKDFLDALNAQPITRRGRRGIAFETLMGLKLVLGTGKRPLEVVTIEWKHIDLDKGTWWNPKELTKWKHGDHLVFLSKYVVGLLKECRRVHPKARWVLPSPQWDGRDKDKEKHITRHALSHAILDLYKAEKLALKFTPHDLRRTFSSRMADLEVEPHIVEKCLDHMMAGSMAVYNRASYFPGRTAAMDLWGKTIENLDAASTSLVSTN